MILAELIPIFKHYICIPYTIYDLISKFILCILIEVVSIVLQIKLSDSFRQASAKLGATIGLRMAEEEGALTPSPVVEVTDVQPTITKSLSS